MSDIATPTRTSAGQPPPIRAVIFDFHQTLAAYGDVASWIDDAWQRAGRTSTALQVWGQSLYGRQLAFLKQAWDHADTFDPEGQRDLSTEAHRRVFLQIATGPGDLEGDFAEALYDTMVLQWRLYDEVPAVLHTLRARGVKVGLLSNIGVDIRPTLAKQDVLEMLDACVLSYEIGAIKPDPAIFERTRTELGVPANETLMVGDTWHHDGGAAQLGMRTLILPVTYGSNHGLEALLRLV